jgi:hypothetical protein
MRKIIFFAAVAAAVIITDGAFAGAVEGISDSGINNIGIDDNGINNNGIRNNDSGINGDNIGINNNNDGINPIPININRKGRAVQVDGFLLVWDAGSSRRWAGSSWTWDAVITAHGIAGYFSHPGPGGVDSSNAGIINADEPPKPKGAPKCHSWTFTFSDAVTKKSFTITIPEESSGEFFAFDNGTFDSIGALTVEWLVPWSFFEDDAGEDGDADAYALALSAACGAAALPPMNVSVASPKSPKAPAGIGTQIAMVAITAALTVALAHHRRRKIREFGRKQEKC